MYGKRNIVASGRVKRELFVKTQNMIVAGRAYRKDKRNNTWNQALNE